MAERGRSGFFWLAVAVIVGLLLWFTYKATVGVPADFLGDFFSFLGAPFYALGDVLGGIWDGLTSATSSVWDGVTGVAGDVWDAVTFWD